MALLTPDVEPLWIAHYDYKRGSCLPLHSHQDYFQLISIVSGGGGEALVESTRFPLYAGHLFFLRPGRRHGLEASPQQPVRTLDTKFRIRHRRLQQACRRLSAVHPEPDRRILSLLETMYAEAQHAGSLSAEICGALLTQVLLLLLRQERGSPGADLSLTADEDETDDLCHRLHHYLREHCADEITQRTLSQSFHYSYHHLHTQYRSRYGESPLRDLKRMRIERAKQLIRYSDYELKHVAKATGFATIHHFTRVFTVVVGTSPARWRDQDCRETRRDVVIHPGFVNPNLVRARST